MRAYVAPYWDPTLDRVANGYRAQAPVPQTCLCGGVIAPWLYSDQEITLAVRAHRATSRHARWTDEQMEAR